MVYNERMSSRGQPRADTRLVPMTREQRDWLTALTPITVKTKASVDAVIAAWDAAPADPRRSTHRHA
jgi:hypothetical protein